MIKHFLLPLLGAALLTACASGPAVNPALTSAVAQAGVTGPTLSKMEAGHALGFNDILHLVQQQVPAHLIESYLQSTEAVYQFSPAQMSQLNGAGASPQLLSYLSHTGGFYATPTTSGTAQSGAAERQATNSPLYQDQQPFAYNAPIIDSWYNSGYEESLYSPFSFN